MQFLIDLWLPILASTVAIFFASFLVWAVLPHHKPDWARMPDEDTVVTAMRGKEIPPGQYMFPHCSSQKEMANEEMQAKWKQGPVGFLYVKPKGLPNMGKYMGLMVGYLLVLNLCLAYIANLALGPGADFMAVFRLVGAVAVVAHTAGGIPHSIWFGRTFASTGKELLDGIGYGIVTGLVFALLW